MWKIGKKLFVTVLVFALAAGSDSIVSIKSIQSVKAATGEEDFAKTENGIVYILKNGLLTIEGSGSVEDVSMLFDKYDDYRLGINSVVIKAGIETISAEGFRDCESLVSLSLPQGLQSIGDYAFWGTNIQSINLPTSCTNIGIGAFAGTKIESVSLPKGMRTIKKGTFSGCNKLNFVSIPNTINKIEDSAFYGCTALKSVAIPKSVKSIGTYALGYKIMNSKTDKGSERVDSFNIKGKKGTIAEIYAVDYGFKFNGNTTHTFKYIRLAKKKFYPTYEIISKKTKEVSFTGFTDAKTDMKSYIVPNTIKVKGVKYKVTRISESAFLGCNNLQKITIGSNVSYISSKAFKGCKKLNKLILKSKKITTVCAGALSGTSNKLVIKCPSQKKKQYKALFKGKGNKRVRVK